jgi:YidC/Oxa1 family membrane protein insertase
MELYKKHKINPVAGCIPMLLTIPFFWAFFTMLRSAAELRFAPFLWAHDLSMPDTIGVISLPILGTLAINILPLLLGVVNFMQMRVTPQPSVDNAQMTSQIAQINTVTGIQQLNTTMQTMASQFSSMQLMQGGGLIGHEVLTAGNTMTLVKGTATGTFDLPNNAADVKVQITDASGSLVATVPMGTQSAGRPSRPMNRGAAAPSSAWPTRARLTPADAARASKAPRRCAKFSITALMRSCGPVCFRPVARSVTSTTLSPLTTPRR